MVAVVGVLVCSAPRQLCCEKRLSSLKTSAVRNAGDTSASATYWPRRRLASVHKCCLNVPSWGIGSTPAG